MAKLQLIAAAASGTLGALVILIGAQQTNGQPRAVADHQLLRPV